MSKTKKMAEYIEIAEANNIDWIVHGGTNKKIKVQLAYGDCDDFCSETEDMTANVAFKRALEKIGIV